METQNNNSLSRSGTATLIGSALLLILIGCIVGHFLFPRTVDTPDKLWVVNCTYGTLNITIDEPNGAINITGFRPSWIWLGRVSGISMFPTMRDGGTTLIEQVFANDVIQVGDIVVFNNPNITGDYIAHRVTEIGSDNEGWYAKTVGDNKDAPLFWVTIRRDDIWGKVRAYFDY